MWERDTSRSSSVPHPAESQHPEQATPRRCAETQVGRLGRQPYVTPLCFANTMWSGTVRRGKTRDYRVASALCLETLPPRFLVDRPGLAIDGSLRALSRAHAPHSPGFRKMRSIHQVFRTLDRPASVTSPSEVGPKRACVAITGVKMVMRDRPDTSSNPVAPTISQPQIPPLVVEATGDGI